MARLGTGRDLVICAVVMTAIIVAPSLSIAQQPDYRMFKSDEYGFTMMYPANWVKVDNPKGNYYVVFQAPDLTDNFRSRIHVAAHKPVKDSIEVFLDEMRNGIKDLQKPGEGAKDRQEVRIIDEGPFKCDVPGAHYFFIQALEDKLNVWMDIVIVFYKHDKTLLRVSCLAPSKSMDKFHDVFNNVLVSLKFEPGPTPEVQPGRPSAVPPPPPGTSSQPMVQPTQPAPYVQPRQPAQPVQPSQPYTEDTRQPPAVAPTQPRVEPTQPAPLPRPAPRGPSRAPSTGIVE